MKNYTGMRAIWISKQPEETPEKILGFACITHLQKNTT